MESKELDATRGSLVTRRWNGFQLMKSKQASRFGRTCTLAMTYIEETMI